MLRETVKRSNLKTQSTDAQRRGGLTRSSAERSVMDLEPRSQVVQPGSYFPPPVKAVAIPKKSGEERTLGIPTFSDRIA
jgi:retron-type reverse transcriptase